MACNIRLNNDAISIRSSFEPFVQWIRATWNEKNLSNFKALQRNCDFWPIVLYPVRPDWAIYCTLGNFSKPVQQLFCPYRQAILVKLLKSFILLVKLFLGNFYRHLTILLVTLGIAQSKNFPLREKIENWNEIGSRASGRKT